MFSVTADVTNVPRVTLSQHHNNAVVPRPVVYRPQPRGHAILHCTAEPARVAQTGGCVALVDAVKLLMERGKIKENPIKHLIAAVSVGIYQGQPVLDLDYAEDSKAQTDMNVIMTEQAGFVEVQGTAEDGAFSAEELQGMLMLAQQGIAELVTLQQLALEK